VFRSVIVELDDVFFLRMEEALEALHEGEALQEMVLLRKRERMWQEANVGPDYYGDDPGPPPDLRAMPKEARHAMESLLWFMENDVSAPTRDGGEQVYGIPASPGRYTGTVRIVRNESEFGKIQPGDVLVCPITTSAWSALFSNIGALVTDTGGVLSHPAIIAREYGIPAVLATGNATSMLQDGQPVTVDGASGQVQVNSQSG
jgi:pyruvate,water dikinase